MRNPFDKSRILIIYTGGTIGMKEDAKTGSLSPFDFSQILQEVPELRKFSSEIDSYAFEPPIDSSDIEPSIWVKLAELIQEKYELYDGFIILHGTDTMAYSASVLSFMLEHLGKPVVFTGSQLPIGLLRTDGRDNLISAVEIASAKKLRSQAMVPEVCIFFNSQLLRGNRATKVDSTSFDAFSSPNYPALADAGINIRYHEHAIHYPSRLERPLQTHTELDTRVAVLKIHPGITEQVARNILLGDGIRGIILETYGSGNAMSKPWFIDIIRESSQSGKILLNVTQCLAGEVNMELYATGKALKEAGVESGYDITSEAALGKLFFLMGKYSDNDKVKSLLKKNLRGEISK